MSNIKRILSNYKLYLFTTLCLITILILIFFDYKKNNTKLLLAEIESLKSENLVSNRKIKKIEKIFQGKKYFEQDIISSKSTKYNLS